MMKKKMIIILICTFHLWLPSLFGQDINVHIGTLDSFDSMWFGARWTKKISNEVGLMWDLSYSPAINANNLFITTNVEVNLNELIPLLDSSFLGRRFVQTYVIFGMGPYIFLPRDILNQSDFIESKFFVSFGGAFRYSYTRFTQFGFELKTNHINGDPEFLSDTWAGKADDNLLVNNNFVSLDLSLIYSF